MSEDQYHEMTGLPKRSNSHVIGEQAVARLKAALPGKWIVREKAPDYGIDCEIEIVSEDGNVTGAIVFAQVKGTADHRRNSVQVKMRSLRYWMLLPVPVIVVHVTKRIGWIDARNYLLQRDLLSSIYTRHQDTISLNFKGSNSLPEHVDELRELAEGHKRSVQEMHDRSLSSDLALDITCHALVYVFHGDIAQMLRYLRDKASDQILIDSYPQAVWIKAQIDADSTFLDRITRIVVQEGFVEPPARLKERYT